MSEAEWEWQAPDGRLVPQRAVVEAFGSGVGTWKRAHQSGWLQTGRKVSRSPASDKEKGQDD